MGYILDDLKQALKSFESSVKKDLEEIRQQKRDVLRLKEELYDTTKGIKYVRDNNTLIVSAPNIILGNVDHNGNLIGEGGGSNVTIRANNVSIEGVGSTIAGGNIVQRAASIKSIAVDPGVDGMENVVCDRSEIVCQASGITLQSDADKGSFANRASAASGINILSETGINIHAAPSNRGKTTMVEEQLTALDKEISNLNDSLSTSRKTVEDLMKQISDLLDEQEDLNDTEEHLRTSQPDISEMHEEFVRLEQALCAHVGMHINIISALAEANRRSDALKETKKTLSSDKSSFEKDSTGSYISMKSEAVMLVSADGDGNLRENDGAGLYVQAPYVSILSHDKDSALIKDSCLDINTQYVNISTASAKLDEKQEKGDITAIGDVTITSKNVTIEGVDRELKNEELEEKALTKESTFSLRMENIKAEATDTEGKSTGHITLNAKEIKAAAMNVDKEKRTDKELAADSQMVLLTDKMLIGSSDKKTKGKLVQVASDKVAALATTTLELQQGEAKAVVTLDGGNLTMGASKNELNGDTTIAGKAEIKGETKAPSGKFDSLEAGKSFKSPNISDGMGVPSAASAGKPSAKLKEEEVKKEEG